MMKILENIPLAELTTFNIGGAARYFCTVTSVEELKEALDFARTGNTGKNIISQSEKLPIFILGGGSNILVSDEGFPGLVVKMHISGIMVTERKSNKNNAKNTESDQVAEVTAGAGENWDDLVVFTVDKGIGGLENLSFIPGTVGAAPVQNIGAYGAEVKNVISSVEVFNMETAEARTMTNAECQFSYRDSIFKKPEGKKYVITRVTFQLSKNSLKSETTHSGLKIDYKDIAEYIAKNSLTDLTIKKVREIVIAIRTAKLPDVSKTAQVKLGTAGSFFKNPVISIAKYEELKKQYPDMPHFPVDPMEQEEDQRDEQKKVKIPAAWLLDKLCGFKGYRDGAIGVYENQALVLVNFGTAKSADILALAKKMSDCVQQKTSIELEREVQVVQ